MPGSRRVRAGSATGPGGPVSRNWRPDRVFRQPIRAVANAQMPAPARIAPRPWRQDRQSGPRRWAIPDSAGAKAPARGFAPGHPTSGLTVAVT
ncbi:hypothetical protein LC55x_1036 [Lysobacter capsici]|nr:hypothetical protein LC55x_1036 [Lysobacter capsici]